MNIVNKETSYQFTDTIGSLFFEGFYIISEDKNSKHISFVVKSTGEIVQILYNVTLDYAEDSHNESIHINTATENRKAEDCAAIFTVIDNVLNYFNENEQ